MARDFQVPGENMVYVKGPSGSAIGTLSELGLSSDQVRVTPNFRHKGIHVNAWGGGEVPADMQVYLADVTITMPLIHFDRPILDECIRLAMGGASAVGRTGRTGRRMGNNLTRFAAGNLWIGLNIAAPVEGKPWRFFYAMLANSAEFPMGVEAAMVPLQWLAIPYTQDPWGGSASQPNTADGTGSLEALLWDHTLDT